MLLVAISRCISLVLKFAGILRSSVLERLNLMLYLRELRWCDKAPFWCAFSPNPLFQKGKSVLIHSRRNSTFDVAGTIATCETQVQSRPTSIGVSVTQLTEIQL